MATIAQYLTQLKQIRADLETAITMIGGTPGPEFSSFATAIQGRAINIFAALEFITGEAAESIDEALQSILASKEALEEAITDKGGTLAADAPLSDYADAVASIPSGSAELPAGVCFASSKSTIMDFSGLTFPDAATRTDAANMFNNCSSVTSLTLPAGFGAAITTGTGMFNGCQALESLTLPAGFGANITNGQSMFNNCRALVSLSLPAGFGARLTNGQAMFGALRALASLTLPAGFGAAITNGSSMFNGCQALESLTLPAGFGAAITNGSSMFYGMYVLSSLSLPAGFANITNASYMFQSCERLTSLELPAGFGANITNASYMFQSCRRLTSLPKFSLAAVTTDSNASQMLHYCNALADVGGFTGLKVSISIPTSSALTLQSIVNIVTEVAAVTTAKTLTLHADAYARAQADTANYEYEGNTYTGIISLANAKGWTIASA